MAAKSAAEQEYDVAIVGCGVKRSMTKVWIGVIKWWATLDLHVYPWICTFLVTFFFLFLALGIGYPGSQSRRLATNLCDSPDL